MSDRDPQLYVEDMLTSIRKIEDYVQGMTSERFRNDEKTIDAVVRNLEILGEAARNIPSEVQERYPDVPWEKMIAMRNKVVHEYFGVDVGILWQTIREDLPALKRHIEAVSEKLRR